MPRSRALCSTFANGSGCLRVFKFRNSDLRFNGCASRVLQDAELRIGMNVMRRLGIARRCVRYLHVADGSPRVGQQKHPLLFQVCGAGTNVGKTVLSAALIRTAALDGLDAAYVKPVQTGYPESNDSAVVLSHAPLADPNVPARTGTVEATTLVKLSHPTSPDLAVLLEETPSQALADGRICLAIDKEIARIRSTATRGALVLVEGAGGVLSPTPSGTLQADAYRQLRLPAILVGDGALGGISNTIAAFDAMKLRGYDVPVVVMFDQSSPNLENATSISRHLSSDSTSVFCAPEIPGLGESLRVYYDSTETQDFFRNLLAHLRNWNTIRLTNLEEMASRASDIFWYPFTQHGSLAPPASDDRKEDRRAGVTAIESAHGMQFAVHDAKIGIKAIFDATGSWWTSGVGHGNVDVTKAIGNAAGRYGHVMFAEAVHEPAWRLANDLLQGPGSGWASRVFYSDNGSTANEVSLKMAFRKRSVDEPMRSHLPVRTISLQGCYHGDTLGAMDCAPPSDYNRRQTRWYEGKCFAFEAPTVRIVGGVWTLLASSGADNVVRDVREVTFKDRDEIFNMSRKGTEYDSFLTSNLEEELGRSEFDFGALIMEPVMLGAGGMRLVDPAFQRSLIRCCRQLGIPVVFDEIFTGLWRLGTMSGAKLLGVLPDIASYGKLLTGGTVPLAVTLAREEVFNAFLGDSKRDALLHGHSYTAHAIGCAAAVEAISLYKNSLKDVGSDATAFPEFWDEGLAREISCIPGVRSTTVMGTVLATELEADDGRGYSSTAGKDISAALLARGIFARPLGNVLYLLCTPLTTADECKSVCAVFMDVLQAELGALSRRSSESLGCS